MKTRTVLAATLLLLNIGSSFGSLHSNQNLTVISKSQISLPKTAYLHPYHQIHCKYMGLHIDKSFTSDNGCKVRIVGDYNVVTGNFSGTITINCPGVKPCVLNFSRIIVKTDGSDLSFAEGDADGWAEFFEKNTDFRKEVASAIISS